MRTTTYYLPHNSLLTHHLVSSFAPMLSQGGCTERWLTTRSCTKTALASIVFCLIILINTASMGSGVYNYFTVVEKTSKPPTVAPTHTPTTSPTASPTASPTTSPTTTFNRGEVVHNVTTITPLKCPNCDRVFCPKKPPGSRPFTSITDGGHTLKKQSTYASKNWGNSLSPYWAARAMAELGGYRYEGPAFGRGSWMEFLPTVAEARAPQKETFDQVCSRCKAYIYFNKGECSEGWSHIAPAIREDTQNALLKHSKRAPQHEVDAIFNFFGPDDWLINNRCCIFAHIEFAPGVLQTYDVIPTEGSFNVYITKGRDEDPFRFCSILIQESIDYIRQRNPLVNVTILDRSSLYVDFARLVFAPNVLVAGMGSSWSLWSAVLANSNNVVAHTQLYSNISMLPRDVHFLADVPKLLSPRDFDFMSAEYGIPPGLGFSNSTEDREAVLRYFRGGKDVVYGNPIELSGANPK